MDSRVREAVREFYAFRTTGTSLIESQRVTSRISRCARCSDDVCPTFLDMLESMEFSASLAQKLRAGEHVTKSTDGNAAPESLTVTCSDTALDARAVCVPVHHGRQSIRPKGLDVGAKSLVTLLTSG
jgi:hypothetical protein